MLILSVELREKMNYMILNISRIKGDISLHNQLLYYVTLFIWISNTMEELGAFKPLS